MRQEGKLVSDWEKEEEMGKAKKAPKFAVMKKMVTSKAIKQYVVLLYVD